MHLPKRDLVATAAVGLAVLAYGLWAANSAPTGLSGTRATGVVVLALGFLASATAVVPSFDQLLEGNRPYLMASSMAGLVALAAGVVMLVTASEVALHLLVGATVILWLGATIHHVQLESEREGGAVRHRGHDAGPTKNAA